jgi:F-type H+-transporting ATPase subunit delta
VSYSQAAERYARALLEVGIENGQLAQLTEQIENFASLYRGDKSLRAVLENPMVEPKTRQQVVADISARLGLSKAASAAISVIVSRRRLPAIGEIASTLRHMADESSGVLRATVSFAQPLSESYFAKVTAQLEKATGQRIILEKKHDPSLLAGVAIQIGDYTVDGSLKGRLADVEQRLSNAG